eukprot:scaffold98900_cov66-Phaeocystis_antarctica.AAC.4
MTRGAKSSLSRWRCAESVVTLSLGYSRVPGPDYQPVALGATVDAFRSTPRRAPSVRGRAARHRAQHTGLSYFCEYYIVRAKQ